MTTTEARPQPSSSAIRNGIDSIIASSDNTAVNDLAQSISRLAKHQGALSETKVKRERGQNAAAVLASYRRSAQQPETRMAMIPKRSTSISKPAKRKRHEDLVAFHRQSCQLFSSLDGTLAQIRMSTSSSSCSSSSRSFPIASPTTEPATRNASLDCGSSPLLIGSGSVDDVSSWRPNTRPPIKRPTLKRMQCSIPPSPSMINDGDRNTTESNHSSPVTPPSEISSCSSASKSSQPKPRSHPPVTTTESYCSSQVALPRDSVTFLPRHPTSTTTISWTSPETRRHEYAKIDAANSGFRLFLRRVFPQSMCRKVGGGRDGFWNDRTEDVLDDEKSVRRFRVSIDEITVDEAQFSTENEGHHNEKAINMSTAEAEVGIENLALKEKQDDCRNADDKQFDEKTSHDHSRTATESSSFSASSSVPMLKRNRQGNSRKTPMMRRLFSCCS